MVWSKKEIDPRSTALAWYMAASASRSMASASRDGPSEVVIPALAVTLTSCPR